MTLKKNIFIYLLILISFPLAADEIRTKRGDIIKGRILKHYKTKILIATSIGKMLVHKKNIKKIKIVVKQKETIYVKLKNGKRTSGEYLYEENHFLYFNAKNKIKKVHKKEIAKMSWKPFKDDIWPYMWRSMLLPSWGQFKDKQTVKGIVIASVFTGLFVGSIVSYSNFTKKQNLYNNEFLHNQVLYDRMKNASNLFKVLLYSTIAVYVFNISDIMLFSNRGFKANLSFLPGYQNNLAYAGLGLVGRF